MIRHCPTCGLDTFSIDNLCCPSGCGTFLAAPPRPESAAQRRRRLRAAWSDEDRAEELSERHQLGAAILRRDEAITRLLAELDKLRRLVPGTAAATAAKQLAAAERKAQARRMHDQGMTVRKIAIALDRTERQVARYLDD